MAGLDTFLATLGVDSSTHDALIKATLDAEGVARGQLDPSLYVSRGGVVDLTYGIHAIAAVDANHDTPTELPHCAKPSHYQVKPFKPAAEDRLLSFSYDIMWDRAVSLQSRALMGKWYFDRGCFRDMVSWVAEVWTTLLGYPLKVRKLMYGWFSIHFIS